MSIDIHTKIKDVLEQHIGKSNAIKSPVIAKLVGIDPGPSNVSIRTLITETIHKFKLPVAATPQHGYFIINNQTDLTNYVNSLLRRNAKNLDRAMSIQTYFHKSAAISPDLYDEDDEPEM